MTKQLIQTSMRTQYHDFMRHCCPTVSQSHNQAVVDFQGGIYPDTLMAATLRLLDPANDNLYAKTAHRTAHLTYLRAMQKLPQAGLVVSYLGSDYKPNTVMTAVVQVPKAALGTKYIRAKDYDTGAFVVIPVDGIFKLTMETHSGIQN